MNLSRKEYYLNFIGLSCLGLLCFCYFQFGSLFAKSRIEVQFMDFPIFVGEIFLFICSYIAALKYKNLNLIKNKWFFLFVLYFCFIIYKAFKGYVIYGPLAFRHAALFYYPAFAILSYSFYDKRIFDETKKILLIIMILLVFALRVAQLHPIMTYFLLAVILSISLKNKKLSLFLLLSLFIVTPYEKFFNTSRMMMLSNFIAATFLITVSVCILDVKKRYKFLLISSFVLLTVFGFIKVANHNELASIIDINKTIKMFNAYNSVLSKEKAKYDNNTIRIGRLFNPDHYEDDKALKNSNKEKKNTWELMAAGTNNGKEASHFRNPPNKIELIKKVNQKVPNTFLKKDMVVPTGNTLFRLFIWNDMLKEIWDKKPVIGIDFGKPLLPISLQIFGWATMVWQRDGWISPHNSFLDIIYRTGVVGVLFIAFILIFSIRMAIRFIKLRSVIGILLCGIVLNWLIASNFLGILESPYTAIPFWTMFGMTYAYLKSIENNPHKSTNNGYFLNENFNNFL